MAQKSLLNWDPTADMSAAMSLVRADSISTSTIDLDDLFSKAAEAYRIFDLKGQQEASLGTLLDSLPVCAFLVDRSHTVQFLNECCSIICRDRSRLTGVSFSSLFPEPLNAAKARALLDRVMRERKPKTWEALMEIEGNRLWARLHLRSVRMEGQLYVLLVLQDMTVEKNQLAVIKENERELRAAAAELERRVAQRTVELKEMNELLVRQINDRKRAQLTLRKAVRELERRVVKRNSELSLANKQLMQEVEHRKRAQLDLQQSSETITALFNATTDVAFLVNTSGTLLALNRSFVTRYGGDPNALVGRSLRTALPPELDATFTPKLQEVIRTGKPIRFELNHGAIITDNTFSPVLTPDGNVESVAVFSQDVTENKSAEQRLILASKIIESSNEGILVTDKRGTIVDVNEAFCGLTGFTREDLVGETPKILKADRHSPHFYRHMWMVLQTTGQWSGEIWVRSKDGGISPELLSISAVRDGSDRVTHYVGIFTDITHIKKTEERLHRMAHFDPLTQLPNRVLFRSRLEQALVEAGRHKRKVALMLLDLDRFKSINDTLGHKAGDDLLDAVARRLVSLVRKSDTVARLGGDEFTIILSDVADAQAAATVARKTIDLFAEPFSLEGRKVFVTASIGITIFPTDGTQVDRLLRNADMALYGAKDLGKNTFKFFSEDMNREMLQRLDLELAIREAIAGNELTLHYQPRLECQTGMVNGVEALLRWNHPAIGIVPPAAFMSLAEETGLVVPIGEWVLREACAQIKRWQLQGVPPICVAVNVSARQFSQPNFAGTVIRILEESGVDSESIELELTESAAMNDAEASIRVFDRLKSHGIRVCIDDFGTGYSSLAYLKRFPIHKLKIDKSFVEDIASNSDDAAIAETIIAIAHTLKLKVVAEGVENREQLDFFRERGCYEWQGFYYSRALPPDQIEPVLGKKAEIGRSASNVSWLRAVDAVGRGRMTG